MIETCSILLLSIVQDRIPSGNHLKKLYMTTAAIRVLPSPVGSDTKVLANSAVLVIDN